jgi:hypothetical protein
MRERPTPSDAREPTAAQLWSLGVDIELRDVWEVLDQMPDMWDDLHLAVIASVMGVAFDRGHRHGKVAGYDERYYEGHDEGYRDGHDEGYRDGYDDGHAEGQKAASADASGG